MIRIAALFDFCDLHASRRRPRLDTAIDAIGRDWDYPRYFDRQGFPIPGDLANGIQPTIAWAYLQEGDPNYARLAWDELPDGTILSTVWIGLDYSFGIGRPRFFETKRFAGETHEFPLANGGSVTGRLDLDFPVPDEDGETTDQLRYCSEEEALATHHAILRILRKSLGH